MTFGSRVILGRDHFQLPLLDAKSRFANLHRAGQRLALHFRFYMMGLAATVPGRMIRPNDDPTTAKISFDWAEVQCEVLARSVEIREARFRVKQRELELIAAKNYLLPNVNLVGGYTWMGQGNELLDPGNSSISGGAFDNLGSGEFQNWNLGLRGSDHAWLPQSERRRL